jgi:putative addiction module CopG family antidote
MTISVSLPTDLEQFVREQMATGRFKSEADVISTAIQLLEEHCRQETAANAAEAPKRRSPRGIMADIPSNLDYEEFRALRRELWSDFESKDP